MLGRDDLVDALERLGELAAEQGFSIELLAFGGAVMVLAYHARLSTRDMDVVILMPNDRSKVRQLAARVAAERDWPDDWLNDAAKGYLVGLSQGFELFSAAGIRVHAPAVAQLLAMKLSAWRDDVDISDARLLLRDLSSGGDREQIWQQVERYLVPGDELKAQYAFQDLWESLHGNP